MIQETNFSGFVKHLMDGVLYFLVLAKILLASTVFSSKHLKLSLFVFLETFCHRNTYHLIPNSKV